MSYGTPGRVSWPGVRYAVNPERACGIPCREVSRGVISDFFKLLDEPLFSKHALSTLFHRRVDRIYPYDDDIVWDDVDNRDALYDIIDTESDVQSLIVPSVKHLTEGWLTANIGWFVLSFVQERRPVIDAAACTALIQRGIETDGSRENGLLWKQNYSDTTMIKYIKANIERTTKSVESSIIQKFGDSQVKSLRNSIQMGVPYSNDMKAFVRKYI